MEAGLRLNLDASHILALPRRDTQRAVLEFVKSIRSFSRVHTAEGKAHMASWGGEEASLKPLALNTRTSQSCGFATPILKSRIPPTLKERSIETATQTPVMTSPKPTCHLDASDHVEVNTSTKPGGRARSKPLPRRESRPSVKRNREFQTDEEKRLQERREKKRTRREIMRHEGKHDDDDDDIRSKDNSKSKKSKQKLPTGLALMYGFTATNVGKNRLTVNPPLRSGVFSKGRASVQLRVRQSKQKGKSLAFSEELFLKSVRGRQRGDRQSISSLCRSSQMSSEPTDNDDRPRQKQKCSKQAPRSLQEDMVEPEVPPIKDRKKRNPAISEARKTGKHKRSRSPLETAQSIIWDIEKDSGVLPSDSSSVLGRGQKLSTVVLNLTQNQWIPPSPQGGKVSCSQDLASSRGNTIDGDATWGLVSNEEEQNTPSLISSVRPSGSPSQVALAPAPNTGTEVREMTASKYFYPASPPQNQCLSESIEENHVEPPVPIVTLQGPVQKRRELAPPYLCEESPEPLQLIAGCEGLPVSPEHYVMVEGTQGLPKDGTGSDWLFSDLDSRPDDTANWGAELFSIEDSPEAQSKNEQGIQDESINFQGEVFHLYEESQCEEEHEFSMSAEHVLLDDLPKENLFLPGVYQGEISFSQLGVDEPIYIEATPSEGFTESDNDHDIDELEDGISSSPSGHLSSPSIEPSEPTSDAENDAPNTRSQPLHFNEGRCLLLANAVGPKKTQGLESIEADVARYLVGHWAPRRY